MKRAYYNSGDGTITLVVPERFAPKIADPYILINDDQSIKEFKVNLATRTLEPLPEDQIPRVVRRGFQI